MANKIYEEEHIRDIANAIREKNGTQNSYLVSEMGDAIRAIEGSEGIPDVELTVVDSGVCGESVYWNLYDNGLLHISGQGDTFDYSSAISPFSYKQDILNVVIDYGITSIGEYMFWRCNSLTTISIPSSVKVIKLNAFQSCNLESVLIPEGVETIENIVFHSCSNIKSVIIPRSITYIGNGAFFGCDNLSTVYYAGTKEEWNAIIIYNDEGNNNMLLNADICYNYQETTPPIVGGVDTSQDTVTEETLGENVTAHNSEGVQIIGKFPISEVDVQYNLIEQIQTAIQNKTSLNNQVFFELLTGDIVEFTIPTSITTIRDGMFYGCTNLKTITIPEGMTSIGRSAFYLCSGLEKIKIPSTVTYISTYAFGACENILEYDFSDWISIPTLANANAFQGINSNCKMKVPSSLLSGLQTASGWSTYKNYMVAV